MALQLSNFYSSDNRPSLIRNYLEDPNSSAELTAKEITAAALASSVIKDEEGDCSLEGFLWELWYEVVEMIKYIPYNHPGQEKMVKLLSAIKEIPRKVTPEMEELERGWGMYFWQDLPIFGAEMRGTWNDGPLNEILDEVGSMHSTFFPPNVWANLNAFAARLTAASVVNFEIYAIWILRHTLEEEVRDKAIDNNLPAAATWFAYAGWLLYHNAAKEYPPSMGVPPPDIRYLRAFPTAGFSEERWEFWKERLEFLQNREELQTETRDRAKETLCRMKEIEGLEPETVADEGSSLPPSGLMRAIIPVQVQDKPGDE